MLASIRRIDDLGRIVIPKDIRHKLGIIEGDPLEVALDEAAGCITVKPSDNDNGIVRELNVILDMADDPMFGKYTPAQRNVIKASIRSLRKEVMRYDKESRT